MDQFPSQGRKKERRGPEHHRHTASHIALPSIVPLRERAEPQSRTGRTLLVAEGNQTSVCSRGAGALAPTD